MRFKTLFILFFIFINILYSQTLTISIGAPENSSLFKQSEVYLQELSKESNIEFILVSYPLERATRAVLDGTSDGEILRTSSIYKSVSSVFKIRSPLMQTPISCYTPHKDYSLSGAESLRGYRIAVQQGQLTVMEYTKQHNLKADFIINMEQGIEMLRSGRLDFLISTKQSNLLKKLGAEEELTFIQPPLYYANLYLFLTTKHTHLRIQLEEGADRLKKNKKTQEIFRFED